jgi:hypothetical protein
MLCGTRRLACFALVASQGDSNVTPLDMSNPLAPVAHPPVGGASGAHGIAIPPIPLHPMT